jgi:hypothetical protein
LVAVAVVVVLIITPIGVMMTAAGSGRQHLRGHEWNQ